MQTFHAAETAQKVLTLFGKVPELGIATCESRDQESERECFYYASRWRLLLLPPCVDIIGI
jgi:hypothetical protein